MFQRERLNIADTLGRLSPAPQLNWFERSACGLWLCITSMASANSAGPRGDQAT